MIQCTDDDKRRLPLPLESKSGIDAAFGKSKGGLGAGASTLSKGEVDLVGVVSFDMYPCNSQITGPDLYPSLPLVLVPSVLADYSR